MYDDKLKQLRRNFLKNNRPKELRRFRREGVLTPTLQKRADACRKEAARLIESGTTSEEQAWQWAIRSELLESPWGPKGKVDHYRTCRRVGLHRGRRRVRVSDGDGDTKKRERPAYAAAAI